MKHIGLHCSISDHGVFVWKQPSSKLFLALATDDCLVLCDDQSQFLYLKAKMEAIFEVTLKEGAILRFLNLRIIQSPVGISIDQTDHIVETIVTLYSRTKIHLHRSLSPPRSPWIPHLSSVYMKLPS
jgi:hypothetical protein